MILRSLRVFMTTLFLMVLGNLVAQDCSCVDCPVDIFNLQTHSSTIDVQVAGPNNLGDCGLNEVCFTIAHTWVGDLSVSLISPSGLKYLVMADAENMPPNGCGNSENNIDICITRGTGNPITNNTEYVCNGSGFFCMEGGGFTVPCGGVTDPFDGALEAPNCDLDDFNVPGHPANGQWTLVVNDICNLNIGQLIDWSISFDCGTSSCLGCDADGGEINLPDIETCVGSSDLDLSLNPTYSGTAPDPLLFDYTFLVIDGGFITAVSSEPDLTNYSAGIYSVCGISFEVGQLSMVESLIGSLYSSIGTNLSICYDLSSTCLGIEIFDPVASFTEQVNLCNGDCYTALDGVGYCATGVYNISYLSEGGCLSSMILDLNVEVEYSGAEVLQVCKGDEILYNGTFYPVGDHQVLLSSSGGCDSLVSLSIQEAVVESVIIQDFISLDCDTTEITLSSSGSVFQGLNWYDDSWNLIGISESISISSSGDYYLEAFVSSDSGVCLDTSLVSIIDNSVLPDTPVFITNGSGFCINEQVTICVEENLNTDEWQWNLPNGIVEIGSTASNCIEIEFSVALAGDICVVGINGCGQSAEACYTIEVDDEPSIISVNEICDLATETFDLEIELIGDGLSVASTNIINYTFSGNTFFASSLPGGMSYTIDFESENCGGFNISNINDCVCDNEAPFLITSNPSKCIGEPIEFENTGPSNNNIYATIFVLHTDPIDVIGSLLLLSNQPYFEYDNSIIPVNIPLYVTGLRGQALPISSEPFIDLQDPCIAYSNQLEFQYFSPEPVTAYIPDICAGDPVQMIVQASAGPFTVYVNGFPYDFSSSGSVLLLPNAINGYVFESYTDSNGCTVEVNSLLEFEIFNTGNISLDSPLIELCNSTWNSSETSVDLSSLLSDPISGSWIDNSNTGALSGSVFDADGLLPGIYSLDYVTDPIGSCPSETLSLDIQVNACSCPELLNQEWSICNTANFLDLSNFIPEGLEGGSWSVSQSNPLAVNLNIEFGTLLFNSSIAGEFEILYDYTSLGFLGCPSVDTLLLRIEMQDDVSLTEDRVDICLSDFPLDLNPFISPGSLGTWIYQGSQDLVLDQNVISSAEVGEHLLYFVGFSTDVCAADLDSILISVVDVPERLALEDKFVEKHCYEDLVQIGSPALCAQSNYQFLWHTLSGAELLDIYSCQPVVTGAGVYEVIIYDPVLNCESIDTVVVNEALDYPDFEIDLNPISCHGASDGSIELSTLDVIYTPYEMYVNGELVDLQTPLVNLEAGDYDILVIDNEGCIAEKNLVLSDPIEMALSIIPFDPVVQIGDQVEIEAVSNYNNVTYNWNTVSGMYNDYGNIISFPVFFNQTVELEAINESGCIRSLTIDLEALDKYKVFVPNIFSPNNDGINDLVTVFTGSDISMVRSLRIFSRWGGLMFENFEFQPNDLSLGWDGFVNGEKAAEGEYVWFAEIELDDGSFRMFKGDVALIR